MDAEAKKLVTKMVNDFLTEKGIDYDEQVLAENRPAGGEVSFSVGELLTDFMIQADDQ